MVLIKRKGEEILKPYGTLTKLGIDYPDFNIRYLQNLNLGLVGKEYKGFVLFRVKKKIR